MTAAPYCHCGCGEDIATEAAAQRHAKVCALLGYPAGWSDREHEWVPSGWRDA